VRGSNIVIPDDNSVNVVVGARNVGRSTATSFHAEAGPAPTDKVILRAVAEGPYARGRTDLAGGDAVLEWQRMAPACSYMARHGCGPLGIDSASDGPRYGTSEALAVVPSDEHHADGARAPISTR
jgi:hypothetical protein